MAKGTDTNGKQNTPAFLWFVSGGVAGQAGPAVARPVLSLAKPHLPITNNYEGVASHKRARVSAICSCVEDHLPMPAHTSHSFFFPQTAIWEECSDVQIVSGWLVPLFHSY